MLQMPPVKVLQLTPTTLMKISQWTKLMALLQILNECYAATIAPSQEDPGHLYASVDQDSTSLKIMTMSIKPLKKSTIAMYVYVVCSLVCKCCPIIHTFPILVVLHPFTSFSMSYEPSSYVCVGMGHRKEYIAYYTPFNPGP